MATIPEQPPVDRDQDAEPPTTDAGEVEYVHLDDTTAGGDPDPSPGAEGETTD